MKKLFGTDGVRGLVNQELDSLLALKLGSSVARILKNKLQKEKLTFLVGSDTRISKDMLSNALIAGFVSEGDDIINLGVIPTPAIAYLIKKYQADGGFVISASHNPSEYNGIKVFDKNGLKLPDEIESEVEELILNNYETNKTINQVGQIYYKDGISDYVNFLKSTINVTKIPFKVCIDTSNGASYETAKRLFSELDIDYTIINNEPDGYNINKNCGSTHMEGLKNYVVENKYDLGIAFDGDCDRCLFVDENGEIVDGDYILAICAKYLNLDSIVGTVMSNLGLIKYCEEENINFISTKVGDRYVLLEMLKNNYLIGGEQSGHIIFKKYLSTGDGELTALQILNIMTLENQKLSSLKSIMKKYPQVLVNLNVTREQKENFESIKEIQDKILEYETKLNGNGRIVVRKSGTENLIRIMFEGENLETITNYSNELAEYIKNILN
ncbi:MAG: phosphoglucosamine mutase [Bacilli bacterium]|nr:phosphoglucosamine mutase [Bacilli bacterium]